ncbi:MAG: hypothetical protein AB7R55_01910 [Gemmatimonadales bacterium]
MHPRHSDPTASAEGSLGRLIATETRLDALVAEAWGRAAALASAARQAAEVAARELDEELAQVEAERRAAAALEMERRAAEIERVARIEAERLETLPEGEIEHLTAWLVDQVIAGVGPS